MKVPPLGALLRRDVLESPGVGLADVGLVDGDEFAALTRGARAFDRKPAQAPFPACRLSSVSEEHARQAYLRARGRDTPHESAFDCHTPLYTGGHSWNGVTSVTCHQGGALKAARRS